MHDFFHNLIAWWAFIAVTILALEFFFNLVMHVRMFFATLTNQTPSVEADVRVLMVNADQLRAETPNPYDRYAAAHEFIQHKKGR